MSGPSPEDHDDEPEGRRFGNLVALAAVIVLVILGYWAFNALDKARRLQNCIDSGRHDCVEIPNQSR
jgi:hypothetical protein